MGKVNNRIIIHNSNTTIGINNMNMLCHHIHAELIKVKIYNK